MGQKILFVGVDPRWDYKTFFRNRFHWKLVYETMDIDPKRKPDILGDITKCPQESKTYDGVILIGVYEYVKDKQKMFDEIYRILKPGGKLLACIPAKLYYPERDKHFTLEDLHYFNKFRVDQVFISHYKTKEPYYFHFFLTK